MAADIFESYEVTIVAGLILGLALYHITHRLEWIVYPLLVRGIGVLCSIIGTYAVKASTSSEKGGDAIMLVGCFCTRFRAHKSSGRGPCLTKLTNFRSIYLISATVK